MLSEALAENPHPDDGCGRMQPSEDRRRILTRHELQTRNTSDRTSAAGRWRALTPLVAANERLVRGRVVTWRTTADEVMERTTLYGITLRAERSAAGNSHAPDNQT